MHCNLMQILLKFVLKDLINDKPTLVQVKAWHQLNDKPLSKSMMV